MSTFNKLVQHYMLVRNLSEQAFAGEINAMLTSPGVNSVTIDRHIVINWAKFDIEPSDTYFKAIVSNFPPGSTDWRVEFAFLALAILKPDLFDLDGGRMWGLAERLVKFHFLNSASAKARLVQILEAEHV